MGRAGRLDNFSAARQDKIKASPTVLVFADQFGIKMVNEDTADSKCFHRSEVGDGTLGEIELPSVVQACDRFGLERRRRN